LYDVHVDNRNEALFYQITNEEWNFFLEHYDVHGPGLQIHMTPTGFISTPLCCHECRTERRNNYDTGLVSIKKVDQPPSINQVIKRRRTTTQKNIVHKEIHQTKTVKQLMMDLMQEFHYPPLYQKLYHNFKELVDQDKTMKELGISPGDELEVQIFDQEHDDFAGIEIIYVDDTIQTIPEQGFQGTMLVGENAIVIDLESWSCSICTFLNEPSSSTCSMCESTKT
jgi:hypothetical protein